jgi:hypothetical protein
MSFSSPRFALSHALLLNMILLSVGEGPILGIFYRAFEWQVLAAKRPSDERRDATQAVIQHRDGPSYSARLERAGMARPYAGTSRR